MPVYLSCSSFNNRVHCQSWSCWADEIQWSRVQYVHQRDPWCALESDERARLAKLTSWTRAADVQKNLGFTHWRWNASPISRWNWDNCESAAPSCQLLIHSTCICIWVAYSCIYIYMCIIQKYKKLTTLRVWTNYKIVKFQINVHDINYIRTQKKTLIYPLET